MTLTRHKSRQQRRFLICRTENCNAGTARLELGQRNIDGSKEATWEGEGVCRLRLAAIEFWWWPICLILSGLLEGWQAAPAKTGSYYAFVLAGGAAETDQR